MQRGLCAHRRGRAHDAPGRRQEHRQVRVHARARLAAGGYDRRRDLPAYPREARRDLGEPRDDEGAPARRRGRCAARRMGRDAPGLESARCRAQPVPAPLSAHGRDHPTDRRQRTRCHADRGTICAARWRRTSGSTTRRRAPMRSSAFRCSGSPGMRRCRPFASRQVLYERFFFGDPVRMAGALVSGHDAQIRSTPRRCASS